MTSKRALTLWRLLATGGIFLLVYGLTLNSLVQKAPTFDEQGFIVRGLAYLRSADEGGTRRIRVGHPPGLNAYNALLLRSDDSVRLPVDDPSWQDTSFHRPAELFLWEIGNDVAHVMFLARVPSVWLGLLLMALIGRWAAEMAASASTLRPGASRKRARAVAGSLALVVAAFDPNLLAHMRLATTDLGLTATAAFAGYGLWRLVRRPSWQSAAVAGVGLGLMLNTKFTSLLFLPLFGVVAMLGIILQWRHWPARSGQPAVRFLAPILLIYPLASFLVLWAGNSFDISTLPSELPFLTQVAGWRLPLAHYLEQLLDIGGRLQVDTPAFLLGHYRTTGWWYYFPVAFLLKTPLPTLALLLWSAVATGLALWTKRKQVASATLLDLSSILIPAVGFFAIALTTEINLGYRHILPTLPFLFVFIGVSLGPLAAFRSGSQLQPNTSKPFAAWMLAGLLVALVSASLWVYPHYLAFFNVLAGGPNNGWRALVDSNLDWGQDLAALDPWMERNGVETVWLSYFGEARPDYYGVAYEGLDSFPPRLMNPQARPFFPADPAPGWYAISATSLQGVHFSDHDQFLTFRDRRPDDKLGYSIFLYDVAPSGEPVNLLLSDLQPDDIAPADFALMATNDVEIRWLDGEQTLMVPQDGRPTWLFAGGDVPLAEEWSAVLNGAQSFNPVSEAGYRIWRLPDTLPVANETVATFSSGNGRIDLLETGTAEADGQVISLTTTWQQQAEPVHMKIFVHMRDTAGTIVAQWDGLGAAWEGWRQGDLLQQRHVFALPADLPAGTYNIVAGVYDPQTLQRWQLRDGSDFVELTDLTIP